MKAISWLLSVVLCFGSAMAFCEPMLHMKTGSLLLPTKRLSGELDGDLKSPREWVLQFSSPIPREVRAQLESQGILVIGYLPENAYLVIAPGQRLAPMLSSPLIRTIVPFSPKWKTTLLAPNLAPHSTSQRQFFQIRALRPSFQKDIVARIRTENLGRIYKLYSSGHILLEGTSAALATLTEIPGIEWIQRADGVQPHVFDPWNGRGTRNGRLFSPRATPRSGTLTGYEAGSKIINAAQAWERGLTGNGQLVTVGDTGLDSGNMGTLHADVQKSCIGGAALQSSGEKSWADGNGHGTHVAGTVLGNGAASKGAFKGLAFEASVFVQGMLLPSGGLSVPEDLNLLFEQAYKLGSRIHSNSWGDRGSFGEYDSNAADADTFLSKNQEMLILFSAGNSGVDADKDGRIDGGSISSPATAKNVLSIGASENLLAEGGIQSPYGQLGGGKLWPVAPIKDDLLSNNINGLAAFSSRGPTKDGRFKPEVVAPGTNIVSLRSQHPQAGTLWGEFNENYTYSGGTSMSTPMVAGAAAILRQYLVEKLKVSAPSGALVKALLIHTATDLFPGQYGEGPKREIPTRRPNNQEGFGRIDIGRGTALSQQMQIVDEKEGLATGETKTYSVRVGQDGHLLATLTYFDAPGLVGSAQALVNDLDLEVEGIPTRFQRRAKTDRVNNTEMVEAKVTPGTYKIVVRAVNVPMGSSRGNRQSFAVVLGR